MKTQGKRTHVTILVSLGIAGLLMAAILMVCCDGLLNNEILSDLSRYARTVPTPSVTLTSTPGVRSWNLTTTSFNFLIACTDTTATIWYNEDDDPFTKYSGATITKTYDSALSQFQRIRAYATAPEKLDSTVATRTIRYVPTGNIVSAAGNGETGFQWDGSQAASTAVYAPGSACIVGTDLYIADTGNNRIRRVDPDGIISTVIGPTYTLSDDIAVPKTEYVLSGPRGITSDGTLVYVSHTDTTTNTGLILSFNPTAAIPADTVLVSKASIANYGAHYNLENPTGVAVDSTNTYLFIANSGNGCVYRFNLDTEARECYIDTIATPVLSRPVALALSPTTLYIADSVNHRIYTANPYADVSTIATTPTAFAGTGSAGQATDGSAAASAPLNAPAGLSYASTGTGTRLYVSDSGNHRICEISDLTGTPLISNYCGTIGVPGFAGEGTAFTTAILNGPTSLVSGYPEPDCLLICDTAGNRVRIALIY
jgi:hypothetical protein